MKKRIRKKTHRGEFTEWGRQIVITRNRQEGFDEFLYAFVEEAVEANGCYCGGGGKEDKVDFIIELGCKSDERAARLSAVTAWLDARPDVQGWKMGEEFDLWRGNFQDIEEEVKEDPGVADA